MTKWSKVLHFETRPEAVAYRDEHCKHGKVRKRRNANEFFIAIAKQRSPSP
jgi:hypothetical protein